MLSIVKNGVENFVTPNYTNAIKEAIDNSNTSIINSLNNIIIPRLDNLNNKLNDLDTKIINTTGMQMNKYKNEYYTHSISNNSGFENKTAFSKSNFSGYIYLLNTRCYAYNAGGYTCTNKIQFKIGDDYLINYTYTPGSSTAECYTNFRFNPEIQSRNSSFSFPINYSSGSSSTYTEFPRPIRVDNKDISLVISSYASASYSSANYYYNVNIMYIED